MHFINPFFYLPHLLGHHLLQLPGPRVMPCSHSITKGYLTLRSALWYLMLPYNHPCSFNMFLIMLQRMQSTMKFCLLKKQLA